MNAGSGLGVGGVGGVGGGHGVGHGVGHGAGAGGLSQAKLDPLRPHQLSAGGVGEEWAMASDVATDPVQAACFQWMVLVLVELDGIGMRRCHDIRRLAMQLFCVDAFTLLLNTIPNR